MIQPQTESEPTSAALLSGWITRKALANALCVTVDTPRPGWRERTLEDPDAPSAVELASANYGPDDYAERDTASSVHMNATG